MLRALLAVTAAAVTLGMAADPASASWRKCDSFEANPNHRIKNLWLDGPVTCVTVKRLLKESRHARGRAYYVPRPAGWRCRRVKPKSDLRMLCRHDGSRVRYEIHGFGS